VDQCQAQADRDRGEAGRRALVRRAAAAEDQSESAECLGGKSLEQVHVRSPFGSVEQDAVRACSARDNDCASLTACMRSVCQEL
jgi:hypothetical protein